MAGWGRAGQGKVSAMLAKSRCSRVDLLQRPGRAGKAQARQTKTNMKPGSDQGDQLYYSPFSHCCCQLMVDNLILLDQDFQIF